MTTKQQDFIILVILGTLLFSMYVEFYSKIAIKPKQIWVINNKELKSTDTILILFKGKDYVLSYDKHNQEIKPIKLKTIILNYNRIQ